MDKLKLPSNYVYKLTKLKEKEGGFEVVFRIASVKDKDSADEWVKQFVISSGVIWRCLRVHKSKGIFNLYRKDFRCQHNTDARFRTKKSKISKNTNCPAIMKLVVQRYFEVENLKRPDEEVRNFPCCVELHNVHNHFSDSAASLRFWPVADDTECIFHHCQPEDRVHYCLYTSSTTMSHIETSSDEENEDNGGKNKGYESVDGESDLKLIERFCDRIKDERQKNSRIVGPAIKIMVTNAEKLTTSALVSAMYSFGKYTGRTSVISDKRKCVQPIATTQP